MQVPAATLTTPAALVASCASLLIPCHCSCWIRACPVVKFSWQSHHVTVATWLPNLAGIRHQWPWLPVHSGRGTHLVSSWHQVCRSLAASIVRPKWKEVLASETYQSLLCHPVLVSCTWYLLSVGTTAQGLRYLSKSPPPHPHLHHHQVHVVSSKLFQRVSGTLLVLERAQHIPTCMLHHCTPIWHALHIRFICRRLLHALQLLCCIMPMDSLKGLAEGSDPSPLPARNHVDTHWHAADHPHICR